MHIVIAGAGKVGFNLARTLCIGHNVTVIDTNAQALQRLQESLDILPLHGDVENSATYEKFVKKEIDFFIAVTNIDNVNLVATLVAGTTLKIKKSFVRVAQPFLAQEAIAEKLSIDKMILPINLTAQTVASLLAYPQANNVKFFKDTSHRLISVMASQDFHAQKFTLQNVAVVGIERNKIFFIPKQDEMIYPNDLVYFFGDEEEIKTVCPHIELHTIAAIRRCVVYGAEPLGVNIARDLLSMGCDVKIVEKDLTLCEDADEALHGKVDILNAKYETHNIFEDEGLDNADIFISATRNDEFNIIKSLEAKERGIKKVVAINNDMEYYSLMHSLGIIVVRGPKTSAYNAIMDEISSSGVVTQKSFCGAKGVVFMKKIFSNRIKKIKPIKGEGHCLFIIRDEKIFAFLDKELLQEGDIVSAFCVIDKSAKVKQWIYEL